MIIDRARQDTNSRFEYVASLWGDTMKVYVESLENKLLKDSVKVVEKIPDLHVLGAGTNYSLIGGTNEHHGPPNYQDNHNHYGTTNVIRDIVNIANEWHNELPTEELLRINDISLPFGGKFDVNGSWRGAHQTHREGKDVDIRTELYYYNSQGQIVHRDGGIPIRTPRTEPFNLPNNGGQNANSSLIGNKKFEKICRRHNGTPHIHLPNSKYEHYHLDFNN